MALLGFARLDIHRVHDADDGRIHRRRFFAERLASGAAFQHDEHLLVHAGADAAHRHERPPGWRALGRQRLHDEQREPGEVRVLPRHDDIADDARDLHYSLISTSSTMPTMAASTGQSFIPAAIRAELPLTMSTVSPTPASTVSTATR